MTVRYSLHPSVLVLNGDVTASSLAHSLIRIPNNDNGNLIRCRPIISPGIMSSRILHYQTDASIIRSWLLADPLFTRLQASNVGVRATQ